MQKNAKSAFLYTIGYEGRSLKEFVNQLKNSDIGILVDVRQIPISRKKGFSKANLSQFLRNYNIDYLHLRELGSPRPLRKKVRLDGDYDSFFKEYSRYIKFQMGTVKELHRIVLDEICCLMCYERYPENCHRSIIAEEIKTFDGNGLIVKHL